jgi:AMP deaminase
MAEDAVIPGGPPDPIAFLRRLSSDIEVISFMDSKDDRKKRAQDPPARERPEVCGKDSLACSNYAMIELLLIFSPINMVIYQEGIPWPYRDTLSFTRSLIFYGAGSVTEEHTKACRFIQESRSLREKYYGGNGTIVIDKDILSNSKSLIFAFGKDGVVEIYDEDSDPSKSVNLCTVPSIDAYTQDYKRLVEMVSDGSMRSFCFQRLQLLSSSFKMHTISNGSVEAHEQSNLLGTDFYRTMKVDNHIHGAAAMSAKVFVDFVRNKLETEGDVEVSPDGQTLKQVFESAGIHADHLTIDAFSVLADYSVYQRFDNFNNKYSPFRMADLRRIFLKTTNHMGGRYFAELLKGVFDRHEQGKGHCCAIELRLSIYGMERHEWLDLAKWVLHDWQGGPKPGPVLSSHNRWLIQVPRLWRIFRAKHTDQSFQGMLDNLFIPMFEATLYPEQNPEVAQFLNHVVGIDSVDDEGAHEDSCNGERPSEWTRCSNPCYSWQIYYIWANLEILNKIRDAKGLNTLAFRPHAGETGDSMHLAATYLLCRSINHGINLHNQVSLQYLYYLDQVGISVSPLSNNFLFRKIATNPFPKLFCRGLNCTLSTDDPLLFHMSDDPLLEEYAVARATFDLSMTDISEIARNSVLQSGFEDSFKRKWLGEEYARGLTFCDETKTHVPLIRSKYRAEHLAIEHMLVHLIGAGKGDAVLNEMKVQFGLARDAHRQILIDNFDQVPQFPEQGQL